MSLPHTGVSDQVSSLCSRCKCGSDSGGTCGAAALQHRLWGAISNSSHPQQFTRSCTSLTLCLLACHAGTSPPRMTIVPPGATRGSVVVLPSSPMAVSPGKARASTLLQTQQATQQQQQQQTGALPGQAAPQKLTPQQQQYMAEKAEAEAAAAAKKAAEEQQALEDYSYVK